MSVPTSSPIAAYTQPSVSNSATRNEITISAQGILTLEVYRQDQSGKLLEKVELSVPANGGDVTDAQGRVYATLLSTDPFYTNLAAIINAADSAVSSWATAGKFNR
jgi:hypothetical protein